MKFDRIAMIKELRRVVQRLHYPLEVMRICVRWSSAYPLSFRNIEEMMTERGVVVDHSTLHRWSIKMLTALTALTAMFRRRQRPVGRSWRLNETHQKIGGQWKYLCLYRVVDRDAHTAAHTAAVLSIQADGGLPIEMRQTKCLNNLVEQDHRAVKRIARPMPGFKSFHCARMLIAGIEILHMIRKGQLGKIKDRASSPANQFCSLAL